MPTVTLDQLAPYSLAGITLLPGQNKVSKKDFDVLSKQVGFKNDVQLGFIKTSEKVAPPPEPPSEDEDDDDTEETSEKLKSPLLT